MRRVGAGWPRVATCTAPSPSPDHRRRNVVSGSVAPVGPLTHAPSPHRRYWSPTDADRHNI
eukprot:8645309-Pyramimonas_sp.AAC.1